MVVKNHGPFLGSQNIRCRSIIGIQKGTISLTTTHMGIEAFLMAWGWLKVQAFRYRPYTAPRNQTLCQIAHSPQISHFWKGEYSLIMQRGGDYSSQAGRRVLLAQAGAMISIIFKPCLERISRVGDLTLNAFGRLPVLLRVQLFHNLAVASTTDEHVAPPGASLLLLS